MLADVEGSFRVRMRAALEERGMAVRVCETQMAVRAAVESAPPRVVIAELRLRDGPTMPILDWILRRVPSSSPVIVVTAYPSVATAVRCARLGVTGYFAKEAAIGAVLDCVVGMRTEAPQRGPTRNSLHRARWEYINQCVEVAGSMASGAGVLGLDKRSLRRMLGKFPPQE